MICEDKYFNNEPKIYTLIQCGNSQVFSFVGQEKKQRVRLNGLDEVDFSQIGGVLQLKICTRFGTV